MKKGEVFAIDGFVYEVQENISCVEIEYITRKDAALFLGAGFIKKKRPVYADYMITVHQYGSVVRSFIVSESDGRIKDYTENLAKEYNTNREKAEGKFTVSFKKMK